MANKTPIYSENSTFQLLEALKWNREKRQKGHEFLVEGVRNITNAVQYQWRIKAFFYSPQKRLSDWAYDILEKTPAEIHYEVSFELLKKLSNKEETSELIALVAMPEDELTRIPIQSNFLGVIFDRPSSPGNLGSLIRSCDGLGVHGMVITGHGVDLYDPETISASTGSLFALPVVRKPSSKELIPWFNQLKRTLKELQIIGTDENGSVKVFRQNFTKPTIVLAGNETWGLSRAYKQMADGMVNIAMQGSASSLNITVATSIVLYEVNRQRANV